MKTKLLFRDLYSHGVRKLEAEWRAGGDDGCVEEIRCFPESMAVTKEFRDAISTIAWDVYEKEFGGGTAGEFSTTGAVNITLQSDGGYKARANNDTVIEEYDKKGENPETTDEENLLHEDIHLLDDVSEGSFL